MATTKPSLWTFLLSAPDLKGLLATFGSTGLSSPEAFVSFGAKEKKIRLVRDTGDDARPHEDVPITGATLKIALGALDTEPTAGFSNGEYNGDATGLAALPAGASAAVMEAALNANPGIVADGGVTVTKGKSGYRVEWVDVGARGDLEWFPGSLTPAARVSVETLVIGDAGKREVKVVKIAQDYWAVQDDWTLVTGGDVTYTQVTAGGPGIREVAKIVITGVPTSGQFKVTAPQSAITTITGIGNTDWNTSPYAKTTVTGFSSTLGPQPVAYYDGKFFDAVDDAGPVRVWYDVNNASVPPSIPAGGRLLEIDLVDPAPGGFSGDWHYVQERTKTELDADAEFVVQATADGFLATLQTAGTQDAWTDWNVGLTFTVIASGNNGRIDGKYFYLYDQSGQVGVWFNRSGETPMPSAVATMSRTIEINGVSAVATAGVVATAIQTALNADAEFSAGVVGSKVTVTDEFGGTRDLPNPGTAGVGVVQTRQGYLIAATLPFDATAAQMRDALLGICDVVRTDDLTTTSFLLTYVTPGAQSDITAEDVDLNYSRHYTGIFTLNTDTMLAAFEATTADSLTGILQAQYQYPGEDPVVFYYSACTVYRSLIDSGGVNPLNSLGATYAEGEVDLGIGEDFVDVVFDSPLSSAEYTVITGYLENNVDAPPDVLFCGTVTDKTVDGYRQYFSGATATANFTYRYIVRLS